jgi:hypothetical protein
MVYAHRICVVVLSRRNLDYSRGDSLCENEACGLALAPPSFHRINIQPIATSLFQFDDAMARRANPPRLRLHP